MSDSLRPRLRHISPPRHNQPPHPRQSCHQEGGVTVCVEPIDTNLYRPQPLPPPPPPPPPVRIPNLLGTLKLKP